MLCDHGHRSAGDRALGVQVARSSVPPPQRTHVRLGERHSASPPREKLHEGAITHSTRQGKEKDAQDAFTQACTISFTRECWRHHDHQGDFEASATTLEPFYPKKIDVVFFFRLLFFFQMLQISCRMTHAHFFSYVFFFDVNFLLHKTALTGHLYMLAIILQGIIGSIHHQHLA